MKKIIFLLLVLTSINSAYGQSHKLNLAVYVTGNEDEGVKKIIASKLVSAITNLSLDYAAIERMEDFLKELNKEHDYQRTGTVDDHQIAKLGKQFGVKIIVVADVISVLGACFISARMIDVETALIMSTAEGEKELNTISDLVALSEYIAEKLVKSSVICAQQDESAGSGRCCEGLMNVDGVCRKTGEGIYWLNTDDCGIRIYYSSVPNKTYYTAEEAKCPFGWRWPTWSEFSCLVRNGSLPKYYTKIWIGDFEYEQDEYWKYKMAKYSPLEANSWYLKWGYIKIYEHLPIYYNGKYNREKLWKPYNSVYANESAQCLCVKEVKR